MQKLSAKLPISQEFNDATSRIIRMTRPDHKSCPKVIAEMVSFGAGPRAGIAISSVARARAFMRGDGIATLDDLSAILQPVLEPRVIMRFGTGDKAKNMNTIVQHLRNAL
jgi:MoxR-like ATPase